MPTGAGARTFAAMTLRTKLIMAGGIVAVVVAGAIVQAIVGNSTNKARAPYAGTYASRAAGGTADRIVLRKDGTWVEDYGGGNTNKSQCASGGGIVDYCWEVVSAHGACSDCAGAPHLKHFSGDRAIFLPRNWAEMRNGRVVSMHGDYYGIVKKGRVLRDEEGNAWVRR